MRGRALDKWLRDRDDALLERIAQEIEPVDRLRQALAAVPREQRRASGPLVEGDRPHSRHRPAMRGFRRIGPVTATVSGVAAVAMVIALVGVFIRTAGEEDSVEARLGAAINGLASPDQRERARSVQELDGLAPANPQYRRRILEALTQLIRTVAPVANHGGCLLPGPPDPEVQHAIDTVTAPGKQPDLTGETSNYIIDLTKVCLPQIRGRQASLPGANLNFSYLPKADLRDADLSRANFIGATLNGTDLTGADCNNATFLQASLSDASLAGARLPFANLEKVNLTGAILTNASLYEADLTGANLTNANLAGADLRSARLVGADLTGADLTGAATAGADFTNAKGAPPN
jgi:hypothetical protein